MIQAKRNTLALQVGVGRGVDGPTPYKALTVEKLLMTAGNRKRGQGSSWTVVPKEEATFKNMKSHHMKRKNTSFGQQL
jgi:hypothetical protein